ncbi:MAG: nuclear transport factor 2 family protein [Gammaproteobacteria bacterium]|nr:nuclear transport factor 2 family protein [Gammaproteobacteria bacterium]
MNDAQKLQWLYDIECIKQLKARYCAFADQDYDPDGIASLFVEDGVWDGGPFGRHEGREAIREFFRGVSKVISFVDHYATNPLIEVNGDTATGRWDLWAPIVKEPEPIAVWIMGKYEEEYVRVGGRWMFKLLALDVRAFSPYDKGFAKERIGAL